MDGEKLPLCRRALPFWDSLEVAAARGQKEDVMKVQIHGYWTDGMLFISSAMVADFHLLWIWLSMFVVERRQSASFPIFSKAVVSQWVDGQKCQLSWQWCWGWTPLIFTPPWQEIPSSAPSSLFIFPEEMGRSTQTICEVSTKLSPTAEASGGLGDDKCYFFEKKKQVFSSHFLSVASSLGIWKKEKLLHPFWKLPECLPDCGVEQILQMFWCPFVRLLVHMLQVLGEC